MPSVSGRTAAAAASTLISSAAEIIYGLADAFFSSSQQLLATTKATAINNSAVGAAEDALVWKLTLISITAKVNCQKNDGHCAFTLRLGENLPPPVKQSCIPA